MIIYGGESSRIINPGGRVEHESVRAAPRWQTSARGPQRPGVSSDQPAFWLTRSPAVSAAFWVRTRGSRGLLGCYHCGRGFQSPPRNKTIKRVLYGGGPVLGSSFGSGLTALGLGVPQNRSDWTQIGGEKVSPRRLQAGQRERESRMQLGVKLTSGMRLLNKVQSQHRAIAVKLGASLLYCAIFSVAVSFFMN